MRILFTIVLLADLPISIPFYLFGWKYGPLAVIWIFVAGTAWWYFLSRLAEALVRKFYSRNGTSAKLVR